MLMKIDVNIASLHPKLRERLSDIDYVFWGYTDQEAVIISGNDGQHAEKSLHYADRAIDLRAWYLSGETMENVVLALRRELGEDFNVVEEDNHIHIEYDPK